MPKKWSYQLIRLYCHLQSFSNMVQKWALLLLAMLLSCDLGLDWQGAGNFTSDNMTVLWTKINALSPTSTAYRDFVVALSAELNTLWDPAWNVVIVFHPGGGNYDVVLYGYAFRQHWFWFNGIKSSNNNYISFVIWKDYNCIRWLTISPSNSASQGTFAVQANIINHITALKSKRDTNDIWLTAQSIQTDVPDADSSLLKDKHAYSIVASQYASSSFFARVCAADYVAFSSIGIDGGSSSGKVLILQMRQS